MKQNYDIAFKDACQARLSDVTDIRGSQNEMKTKRRQASEPTPKQAIWHNAVKKLTIER
jgi:hypothetical protein